MASYKITRVSEQPPRTWDNPKGGTIYYIKVAVEGWDKPIEVGKKTPDALKVGEVLEGTITPTEYPNDKFKADPPQNNFQRGGAPRGTTPEDKESIARSVALKAAVDLAANLKLKDVASDDVLIEANKFLAWLKNEQPDEPHYEKQDF